MQQPTLTKKQVKFLTHIGEEMSPNDKSVVQDAFLNFSKNGVFNEAFNQIVAVGTDFECINLENYYNLCCPIQIIQPEGRFNAEMELSIFKDEETPKAQFIINCANEIFYDLPMNVVDELGRFWETPQQFYKLPTNSMLICSKYLDNAFFAINKDYCFIADFDNANNNPVKINTSTSYFSSKAFKGYPDYTFELDKLRKDKPFYTHNGGTRRFETSFAFDKNGKLTNKSISVDTFFKVLREFRQYNIKALPKGCEVERVEFGHTKPGGNKSVKLNSLNKKVNMHIEELDNLNKIIYEFEKRCSGYEKSRLNNTKKHKAVIKNNSNLNLNNFYKEFWEYQRSKIGKSYAEQKQFKEDKHDKSILWELKQQALKQQNNTQTDLNEFEHNFVPKEEKQERVASLTSNVLTM